MVPAEADWGQSGLGFAVSGLPYGTFAEVPTSIEIVLGFAVLVLSPRVCAHFLEAQSKKSVFETIFLTKSAQMAGLRSFETAPPGVQNYLSRILS